MIIVIEAPQTAQGRCYDEKRVGHYGQELKRSIRKMGISNEIVKSVEEGKIVFLERDVDAKYLVWNVHSTFKGVFLKHLVTGESTDGKFSCHLVRVESGCEIGEHIHEGKWELHEIIGGLGRVIFADKEIVYEPGVSAVIPEGVKHRVIAEEKDLYLLAKFVPALI
jgi:quercetin dioxygenase-like cupin family protein